MNILILSPDYASHYYPLSALGHELQAHGHDVVVGTGAGLASRVTADGFAHRELTLGPGRNSGLSRIDDQPDAEAAHLQSFFDATREGMIASLRYQAEARLHDLLWEPAGVKEQLAELRAEVRPDLIISDQLAFGATLALRALGAPFVSFHPGHPAAIPGPGEVFGFPSHRPPEFKPHQADLSSLWILCTEVSEQFTRVFNEMLLKLNPSASPVTDAFSSGSSELTLINYPRQLGGYRRAVLPPTARFIGASVRNGELPEELAGRLDADVEIPRIYVSLGSFLSARTDVLQRIVFAFQEQPVEVILASGVTPVDALGQIPDHWIVAHHFPQTAVLPECDLVISHGGNNTVTEALWAGAPLLICPFSTDQFAGAEDVRRAGLGDVFDPNGAEPSQINFRANAVLASHAPARAADLGQQLRSTAGPPLARRLLERVPKRRPTTLIPSAGVDVPSRADRDSRRGRSLDEVTA